MNAAGMRRVSVITHCPAVLSEEWIFDVPADWTEAQVATAFEEDQSGMTFVKVDDSASDERDRIIDEIEFVDEAVPS